VCLKGSTIELTAPANLQGEMGSDPIEMDSCIAGVIRGLWDMGLATAGCCCGHFEGDGWVCLEDALSLQEIDVLGCYLFKPHGPERWTITIKPTKKHYVLHRTAQPKTERVDNDQG